MDKYDINQLKELSLFPLIIRENMRYQDLDPNSHVNNVVFATYLEVARGRARRHCLPPRPPGSGSVVGRLLINYHREMKFPGAIDVHTAIVEIGRSSWSWGYAICKDGVCCATAESTTILVDLQTKKSMPMPQDLRDALEALRLRKTEAPRILTSDTRADT